MTEARLRFPSSPFRGIEIVAGRGATLWDREGRAYVDCGASFGVVNAGHGDPRILRAAEDQLERLTYVGPAYGNDAREAFLERLLACVPSGLARAFLCNSGTEAVEAALKMARSATGRAGIVAAMRGFHGRTMGALSATWKREYREPFEPLLPDVTFVPFGDAEALDKAVTGSTGAVILEPVQGEGGVHVAPPDYLGAAKDICARSGSLLIVDEVQTGLGRTGTLFACGRYRVAPDILCLAKSLANGLPIGATLTTEEVTKRFRGSHNSTFGGGAVVCAAARATLDVILGDRLDTRAEDRGRWLRARLEAIDSSVVREVRGLGLMVAVELRHRAGTVLDRLAASSVLALPAGTNGIRLLPPLVITNEELDRVVSSLAEALSVVRITP